MRALSFVALSLLAACGSEAASARRTVDPPASAAATLQAKRDTVVVPDSIRRPPMPRVPTPTVVRGLYVNRWAARGDRMWELIDVAKRTEVNALVIDVKDDRGFVLY